MHYDLQVTGSQGSLIIAVRNGTYEYQNSPVNLQVFMKLEQSLDKEFRI